MVDASSLIVNYEGLLKDNRPEPRAKKLWKQLSLTPCSGIRRLFPVMPNISAHKSHWALLAPGSCIGIESGKLSRGKWIAGIGPPRTSNRDIVAKKINTASNSGQTSSPRSLLHKFHAR